MSNNHDRERELQLDNHIAALRDEPIPDGPSPQLMQMTIKQIDSVTGRRTLFERLVHMTFVQKIAAAVLFTLGALTLYFMFMLFSATSSVAFADVALKLKDARTMIINMTVTLPGKPPMTSRMLLAEPNRMRTEMSGSNIVTIHGDHAALILDNKMKTATRIEIAGTPARHDPSGGIVEAFRKLGQATGKPAGEKQIDGVAAIGFNVDIGNQHMTVWADKKTATPIRVETKLTMAGGEGTMVMDHFELDKPLDDALFSLDVPKGYTLTTQTIDLPDVKKLDENIVGVLKTYTDASGGKFPASLDDWGDYIKTTQKDKVDMKAIGNVGAITGFLMSQKHGYFGKGVMLGEKDKIVFWRQPDAKKPTYKAIYGDLRVEEVTEDKLPTTQATTQPASL